MVVDAGSVLTSGGSNAFYDLALYLIEQYIGYEAAQFCSHHFPVDARRSSQSPFMPAVVQRQHSDSLVLAVQSSIERSFREQISPDAVAAHVGLSSRSLFRRFKSATGETPNTYQQRLRVDAAKRRLSEADDSIEEISFSVGYESVSFFRQVFKKHTGDSIRWNTGAASGADCRAVDCSTEYRPASHWSGRNNRSVHVISLCCHVSSRTATFSSRRSTERAR